MQRERLWGAIQEHTRRKRYLSEGKKSGSCRTQITTHCPGVNPDRYDGGAKDVSCVNHEVDMPHRCISRDACRHPLNDSRRRRNYPFDATHSVILVIGNKQFGGPDRNFPGVHACEGRRSTVARESRAAIACNGLDYPRGVYFPDAIVAEVCDVDVT
jgi:hypothetical protein